MNPATVASGARLLTTGAVAKKLRSPPEPAVLLPTRDPLGQPNVSSSTNHWQEMLEADHNFDPLSSLMKTKPRRSQLQKSSRRKCTIRKLTLDDRCDSESSTPTDAQHADSLNLTSLNLTCSEAIHEEGSPDEPPALSFPAGPVLESVSVSPDGRYLFRPPSGDPLLTVTTTPPLQGRYPSHLPIGRSADTAVVQSKGHAASRPLCHPSRATTQATQATATPWDGSWGYSPEEFAILVEARTVLFNGIRAATQILADCDCTNPIRGQAIEDMQRSLNLIKALPPMDLARKSQCFVLE